MEQEIQIPLDAIVKITRCGYDKTYGDIATPIPSNAYVRVKQCGLVTEIMYSQTHSRGSTIRKINKDKYVIINTESGEISDEIEFNKTSSRKDNVDGIKTSLKKARDLINTNCSNLSNCKWITLTYDSLMNDTNKLTNDFKNFNKRCHSRYGSYNYIAINEPQGNGSWHIHCILIFDHHAPYMDCGEMRYKIWQQGMVNIQNIDNIDGIVNYLTVYTDDIDEMNSESNSISTNNIQQSNHSNSNGKGSKESDSNKTKTTESSNKKKTQKKDRFSQYSVGCNIYRCSKHIKKPIQYYDLYQNIINSDIGDLTYKKVYNIASEDNYSNTIIYENYKKKLE